MEPSEEGLDDQTAAILAIVRSEGPVSPAHLLAVTDCCESDLHGRLQELRAAELVTVETVAGRTRYRARG